MTEYFSFLKSSKIGQSQNLLLIILYLKCTIFVRIHFREVRLSKYFVRIYFRKPDQIWY